MRNFNSNSEVNRHSTSFLRWAGSKKQLLPFLHSYWAIKEFGQYIEPFVGAGHLLFSLPTANGIINDINGELIITYSVVKEHPLAVSQKLMEMPISEHYYYWMRSLDVNALSLIERGARFIYLNRYCFNGLYRINASGRFNVPYSPDRTGSLPNEEKLQRYSDKLKNFNIYNKDFEEVIYEHVKCGDFVYLDPPYFNVSGQRIFTEYSFPKFNNLDYLRLVECLNYINATGAYFVLSYQADDYIVSSLKSWNIQFVDTKRKISSNLKSRKAVVEILVSNIEPKTSL